jgi:hypothetical protein
MLGCAVQLLPPKFAVEALAEKNQTSLICKYCLVAPRPFVAVVQQGRQRDLVVRAVQACSYAQLERLQMLETVCSFSRARLTEIREKLLAVAEPAIPFLIVIFQRVQGTKYSEVFRNCLRFIFFSGVRPHDCDTCNLPCKKSRYHIGPHSCGAQAASVSSRISRLGLLMVRRFGLSCLLIQAIRCRLEGFLLAQVTKHWMRVFAPNS